MILLVERIRPGTVTQNVAPNPLDQELPSDAVHVVRGAIVVVHQLARVGPAASRAVDTLAEISNLHRESRVLTRVPSVHERVARQLGNLVGDDAYHPLHAHVTVRRF